MSSKVAPIDAWHDPSVDRLPELNRDMSQNQKELYYAVTFVSDRLKDLKLDEAFELHKTVFFFSMFLITLVGLTLLLLGLSQTVLFEEQKTNYIAIAFGCLLCIPAIFWAIYIVCPGKKEAARRKDIYFRRAERNKPNLYDAVVEEAKEFSKPPVSRISLNAILRKKRFVVTASTMREFCELVEKETGLPVAQQIIKFRDLPLPIRLDDHLEFQYHFHPGDTLKIYNRGGFETQIERLRVFDKTDIVHAVLTVPLNQKRQKKTGLDISISDEATEELHRSTPATAVYQEAPPIGAVKIEPKVTRHVLKHLQEQAVSDHLALNSSGASTSSVTNFTEGNSLPQASTTQESWKTSSKTVASAKTSKKSLSRLSVAFMNSDNASVAERSMVSQITMDPALRHGHENV